MVALPAGLVSAAGVPPTLTHHGYLTDDHGAPVTRSLDMSFALFDDPSGGTKIWSQDIAKVPITDGFYMVTLGLGTTPSLDAVFAAQTDAYLEITVDGQRMLPRQKVGAVPYALVAGDAVGDIHPQSVSIGAKKVIDETGAWVGDPVTGQGVQSVSGTAPITANAAGGAVTIGIPKATKTADGYLAATDWAAFTAKQNRVSGTCPSGFCATGVHDDGTLDCGACAAGSGGGTVTEVRTGWGLLGGPIKTSGQIDVDTTYFNGLYVNRAGDTLNGQYNILLAGGNGGLSVGLDQLVCAADGNVGVGTSSPQTRLDVAGDVRAKAVQFGSGSSLVNDTNGAIELGNSSLNGTTPYVDFHYGKSAAQDYNMRVVNDVDGQLSVLGGTLHVGGNVVVDGQVKAGAGQAVYSCPLYNESGCLSYCNGGLSASSTCAYYTWSSGCYNWGQTQPCSLVGRLAAP